MVTAEPAGTEQYDAFISYNLQDAEFAEVLEKALEAYKPPPGLNLPARYLRIFRFEGDMTGVEYDKAIQEKIQNSAKLIVICSPAARQKSEYLDDEIRRFVQAKGAENIIPVIVSGIPNNEAKPEQAAEMAFPDALCQVQRMPLGTDYRRFNLRTDQVNKGNFSNSWYKLLADLLDRSREEIEQRDLKRQIRRRNIAMAIVSSVMVILLGLSVYAWWQKSAAETQAKIALARQLVAQAELLKGQGGDALTRSVLLATESMQRLPSLEGNQVLSGGLSLIPRHVAQMQHRQAVQSWLSPVCTIAVSPDGKYLATASGDQLRSRKGVDEDGMAQIWEIATGAEVARVKHARQVVVDVAFTPDGKYLVTRAARRGSPGENYLRSIDTIGVWEISGRPIVYASSGSRIAFSQDKKYVAEAIENRVRVREVSTGRQIIQIAHEDPVDAVAFSAEGRYLLASGQATSSFWDVTADREIAKIEQESGSGKTAVSPDGRYRAQLLDDGARLEDTVSGKVMDIAHGSMLSTAVFSPNAPFLITANWDYMTPIAEVDKNIAQVWEVTTGREVARLTPAGGVFAVALSRDGKYLATSSWTTATVWESPSSRQLEWTHSEGVRQAIFSPDGKCLAATIGKVVYLWAIESGLEIKKLTHRSLPYALTFSRDGKYLATATLSVNSKVIAAHVWDVASGEEIGQMPHEGLITGVTFSPDSRYLATSAWDYTARIWKIKGQQEVLRLTHKHPDVNAVAFSPDGRLLATTDGDLRPVGDILSLKMVAVFTGPGSLTLTAMPNSMTLPDGRKLPSGDFASHLWEVNTGKQVAQLRRKGIGWRVAFSHSGKYLATASWDNHAQVMEVATGKEIATMTHERGVWAIAFSPDDRYLATASGPLVRVWEATTGKDIVSMRHESGVSSIVFSPDQPYLATVSGAAVRVYEATTGRQVAGFTHKDLVGSVAFSPDGKYLASASLDRTIRLAFWQPQDLIDAACRRLTRNLSPEEWRNYVGTKDHRRTCSQLP